MRLIHCSSSTLAIILLCGQGSRLLADVQLPGIISDHMVLMRSAAVPIWGKADAGEEVTVTFYEKPTARAVAGADGKWKIILELAETGPGPHELVVKARNEIRISDALVGAVWLASGQSNMEFSLRGAIGAEEEIAHSLNSQLRQFKAEKASSAQPVEECKGGWNIASPATAGGFTAVGYYFGKRLQKELGIPVGIINASWGGTMAEFWISEEAISKVESLRAGSARQRQIAAEYPAQKQRFVEAYGAWLRTNHREDRPCEDFQGFAGTSVTEEGWSRINLPGAISASTGAIWIRRDIQVSDAVVNNGPDFKVMLGRMEGFEQAYWNGTKVSETPYQKFPGAGYTRYFPIPKELLRTGKNTIFAPSLLPNIDYDPEGFKAGPVSIAGEWLVKAEYEFPPISPVMQSAIPKSPVMPPPLASRIFNGLVNPLTSYDIAGVLWYQGESNTGRAYEYRTVLPLLIEDWRAKWNRRDLPFYICQLPG